MARLDRDRGEGRLLEAFTTALRLTFRASYCLVTANAREQGAAARAFVGWRVELPAGGGSWWDHLWLDGPMLCILAVVCLPRVLVVALRWATWGVQKSGAAMERWLLGLAERPLFKEKVD